MNVRWTGIVEETEGRERESHRCGGHGWWRRAREEREGKERVVGGDSTYEVFIYIPQIYVQKGKRKRQILR